MNLDTKYKYVFVSKHNGHNCVYDLKIDQIVEINGELKEANEIKVGDNIKFTVYSNFEKKDKDIEFVVKYVGFSYYPPTCFAGDCIVSTYLRSKKVSSLIVGDLILCPNDKYERIKCILETKISRSIEMMVHKKGLVITPYHPVRIDNEWIFPIEHPSFTKETSFINSIYSIGLDSGKSFLVNDIEVIGLGHGIHNDPVASHSYFGSEQVINDIFEISRHNHCIIFPEQVLRDSNTGLVNKIVK
jgi:hypothetical protein